MWHPSESDLLKDIELRKQKEEALVDVELATPRMTPRTRTTHRIAMNARRVRVRQHSPTGLVANMVRYTIDGHSITECVTQIGPLGVSICLNPLYKMLT